MQVLILILVITCVVMVSVNGFRPARMSSFVRTGNQIRALRMEAESGATAAPAAPSAPASKGFGKAKAVEKADGEDVVEMSAGDKTYASQAKRGVPEYNIFIRPKDGGEEEWVPVGSMTIPRDTPVGKAIYDVEGELLKGTFKLYPKLKAFYDVRSEEQKADMWEYGSTLKAFPDEPIVIRTKDDGAAEAEGGNFFTNWVKSITNPVDSSGLNTPGAVTMNQNGPSKKK